MLLAQCTDATGDTFSKPYLVEGTTTDGRTETAFLKALDFTVVQSMGIPIADALQILTQACVFERDLVLRCSGPRMRNVVAGVDAGDVVAEDPRVNPILGSVPFIIFECAIGDVRSLMEERLSESLFDEAWAFRILHGTANGLRQF
jgi:hypothetical protein